LLLGEEFVGVAVAVARVAGIALIGLGVACWPGPPIVGMLIYGAAVALYLAHLGLAGSMDRHPPVTGSRRAFSPRAAACTENAGGKPSKTLNGVGGPEARVCGLRVYGQNGAFAR